MAQSCTLGGFGRTRTEKYEEKWSYGGACCCFADDVARARVSLCQEFASYQILEGLTPVSAWLALELQLQRHPILSAPTTHCAKAPPALTPIPKFYLQLCLVSKRPSSI